MMSVFQNKQMKCNVCGCYSEQTIVCSTNQIGSPDLDLRPPQMERSIQQFQVQECPFCGYSNLSIEMEPPRGVTRDWLQSGSYQSCDGIGFVHAKERKYYRYYLICRKRRRLPKLFRALCGTIWMCDDDDNTATASLLRLQAASLARKLYYRTINPIYRVIECDLLRRAGKFDAVKRFGRVFAFKNRKLLDQIIEFEKREAAECNPGCFTVAEALEKGQKQ